MYAKPAAQEQSWDRSVATAAPATPHRNTATKSRSSRIFTTEEINRKYSVARLSPRERRMAATML